MPATSKFRNLLRVGDDVFYTPKRQRAIVTRTPNLSSTTTQVRINGRLTKFYAQLKHLRYIIPGEDRIEDCIPCEGECPR